MCAFLASKVESLTVPFGPLAVQDGEMESLTVPFGPVAVWGGKLKG